jgi:hypothetical protein
MPLAFRQFLMTNFLSAEFILAFWRANLKISAKCRVQGAMFNAKVFRQCKGTALQKIAVSPFANRHSLLAIHHSLPFYQSPVAIRHSLPFFSDLPICRPHDLPKTRLGRNLALPLNSVLRSAL